MTKNNGTSIREEYLNDICNIMRSNEKFLYMNSRETSDEIIELANDAIDCIRDIINSGAGEEGYVKYATSYFLNHVLMPASGAIYLNALTGNLPDGRSFQMNGYMQKGSWMEL